MTGGQVSLSLATEEPEKATSDEIEQGTSTLQQRGRLRVIKATETELTAHEENLQRLQKASGGQCVWLVESSSFC